jgi:hypothetical protein
MRRSSSHGQHSALARRRTFRGAAGNCGIPSRSPAICWRVAAAARGARLQAGEHPQRLAAGMIQRVGQKLDEDFAQRHRP